MPLLFIFTLKVNLSDHLTTFSPIKDQRPDPVAHGPFGTIAQGFNKPSVQSLPFLTVYVTLS